MKREILVGIPFIASNWLGAIALVAGVLKMIFGGRFRTWFAGTTAAVAALVIWVGKHDTLEP